MALSAYYRKNFDTLRKAFGIRDVCLLEVQERSSGQKRAAICAVNRRADNTFEFVPFAIMVHDNPFELFDPPDAAHADGFVRRGGA